jgi:hypothetical protein
MAAIAAVAALVITPAWIVLDEFVDLLEFLPFALMLAVVISFYFLMKRRFQASRNETVQALFIFLMVAFAILTVTGVWFRGAGMALVWPWNL